MHSYTEFGPPHPAMLSLSPTFLTETFQFPSPLLSVPDVFLCDPMRLHRIAYLGMGWRHLLEHGQQKC